MVDRGIFHRRNQRGGAPPMVPGAGDRAGTGKLWHCRFCDRVHRREVDRDAHEQAYHKKRIKRMKELLQE